MERMKGVNYCYDPAPFKQWSVKMKTIDFYEVERYRRKSGLSRAEFLKMLLIEKYDAEFSE